MTGTRDMRMMPRSIRLALVVVAAAVGMLLMLPSTALANGDDHGDKDEEKVECPGELIASYKVRYLENEGSNINDPEFELKSGDGEAITIEKVVEYGDITGLTWEASDDTEVDEVIVGGERRIDQQWSGVVETYSGETKTIDFGAESEDSLILFIKFCAPEPDDEEPSEEPTDEEPSEEPTDEEPSEEPTDEEPSEEPTDDDDDDVGGIPVPTRIDTGAGGTSGPLPSVLALLILAGASFAGATTRLVRSRA